MSILEVQDLCTTFFTDDGVVPAVSDVSFKLEKGETLGIVGESGSGKTVTSKTLMRIIPSPPGKITGGKVRSGLWLRFDATDGFAFFESLDDLDEIQLQPGRTWVEIPRNIDGVLDWTD